MKLYYTVWYQSPDTKGKGGEWFGRYTTKVMADKAVRILVNMPDVTMVTVDITRDETYGRPPWNYSAG